MEYPVERIIEKPIYVEKINEIEVEKEFFVEERRPIVV